MPGPKPKVELTCEGCGTVTMRKPSEAIVGRNRFCSPSCRGRHAGRVTQARHPVTLRSILTRFWKYVDRKSADECWPWTGALNGSRRASSGGYGSFGIRGMNVGAHVFSWTIHTGGREPPYGMCVCHSCDNPKCVNPDHLWLGTVQENINDKVLKGRQPKGETHGMHRSRRSSP